SLDAWRRARDAQGQDQDQNQNQGQPRGQDQDRGQAGTPSPNQNLPNQNLGPGRAQESGNQRGTSDLQGERWRGRGEDRARYYDRRRSRAREDSPRLGVAAPGAAALARTRSGPFGAAV